MAKQLWQLTPNDRIALGNIVTFIVKRKVDSEVTPEQGFLIGDTLYTLEHTVSSDLISKLNSGERQSIEFTLSGVSNFRVLYDSHEALSGDCYLNGVAIGKPTDFVAVTKDSVVEVEFATCLTPDTSIAMVGGNDKPLSDVRIGDAIETPLGNDIVTSVPVGVGSVVDVWEFDNGTTIKTVGRHRFWNCELSELMYLEAWHIGEHAQGIKEQTALVSHRSIEKEAPYATLFTQKFNLYYANGLLAGNRHSIKVQTVGLERGVK